MGSQRTMRRLVAIALMLSGVAAFGSSGDPCSLAPTVTVNDVQVSIAIGDGRTSFREGEIIPLVLSFTSTADKRYWVDDKKYDRSGRLGTETYCVEPEARDPLADYFRFGGMAGGLFNQQQLSEKPFTATAELNEWRQPGPGHYQMYAVSHRVWRPPDPDETTPYGRIEVTVRSNTIEFDVVKADAEWSAQQLQEATAAYQNANVGPEKEDKEDKEQARRLRFLNTRQSAETMARLYWGLNDQPGGWDLMFGLFGSPYRAEAIAAMEREINNPDHPITQEFLHTLTSLQGEAKPPPDPPEYDAAHPGVAQEYWNKRQAHERELMQAAVALTAAALPRKTGRAHALTVQALVESSDLLSGTAASQVRKLLVASWGNLSEQAKLSWLQYRWPLIAGPEMLPILKEFVSHPASPTEATARNEALKHIYELDATEGRALILRELRNPKAQPPISLVKLLSGEELQPAMQEALGRIVGKEGARELDYHLVELFAGKSALDTMKAVFTRHAGEWACDPQGAMLRYFLRLDPEFGAKAVQASLATRKMTGCYRSLLQDLGKSLPKVEPIAISALDDPDLQVASDAALALGRWGTAKAEKALWARLKRFHQEWQGRVGELRYTPEYSSPIARATALEGALVNSIVTGMNWICGPEKFEKLRALASPRQQQQIPGWSKQWEGGSALIIPNWYPEDHPTFQVLQYTNLDEEQMRAKLSQIPGGMKLYFQIWKPGQILPPVSVEKQEAVFQELRSYAAGVGVTIEARE